jgi:rhodanese-related sulfurtransferase
MDEDTEIEGEGGGRWKRARRGPGGRRWLGPFLVIVVVPILIGAVVLLVLGRAVGFETVRRLTVRKFPDVQWISAGDLTRWWKDTGRIQPILLDARTSVEYQVSHLQGGVLDDATRPSLRPLGSQPQNAPIVVYGSVGYRGARLAAWLQRHGYTNVRNLTDGIFRWANQGHPLVRDGRPTTEVHPYDRRWGFLLDSRHRATAPELRTPFAAP